MKKFLGNFILGIWLIIAIFTTVTLLSFNDYRVSEFGSYSMFCVDSGDLEPMFSKGDLVIQEKTSDDNINIQDNIFFYNESSNMALINLDIVSNKEVLPDGVTTYKTSADKKVSSDFVIGKAEDAKVIHNIGYVLSVLQSKWGFMFLIIFPTIFLFIYEIYGVFVEYQKQKQNLVMANQSNNIQSFNVNENVNTASTFVSNNSDAVVVTNEETSLNELKVESNLNEKQEEVEEEL